MPQPGRCGLFHEQCPYQPGAGNESAHDSGRCADRRTRGQTYGSLLKRAKAELARAKQEEKFLCFTEVYGKNGDGDAEKDLTY